jgi:hypothetical protein
MQSRRIAPSYSFRFTASDIRDTYGSAERAFSRGDFLNAAQMAPEGSDLRGCSLTLGGLLEQGLDTLENLPSLSGRAQLCRAFALWSLNRPKEAVAALENFQDRTLALRAENFRKLLARENINIFITGAILSVFPEHYSESFIAPVYKYGEITVKYVGSQVGKNAYDYSAVDSLDAFIEELPDAEKPDILFSLSPQWLLAKDFHKVAVPKVIWCHDSDAFQYRNVDNYALYDVAIGNCSQEHFELSQGTPGLYCAANMLLHPLATPFPEASPDREKKFDIIFTGSALAPFHSEKPRFLFKLSELGKNFIVRVVEGHLPEKDYFALISHAKFLPVVNRYAGSPSPRWRDALANGAFLLYPDGSFYGEIAPGCFTYRAETMVDDIRKHIEEFAVGKDPAYDLTKVVPEINERFAIHRQPREENYERLLKYALFVGLIWPRSTAVAATQRQRRLVWLTPAVDCGLFGTTHICNLLTRIGANISADELLDSVDYNNAAHLHAQMVFTFHERAETEKWAAAVDRYFAEGLARFPNSLLLVFNEAHWSFFKPKADMVAAAVKFRSIIDRIDNLAFDPSGADVAYAYTLHERDEVFPCYEYADVATSEMVLQATPQLRSRKTVQHSTRTIILSACYGYIGWAALKAGQQAEGLVQLKRAIAIYPHGLPVLRLYFDTLLQRFLKSDKPTQQDAVDLADAFVAVINVNPSPLLTHVFMIVPLLADNGERKTAKDVLAAWYQLANIVHSLPADGEKLVHARMDILWNYQDLFPLVLAGRIKAALKEGSANHSLTQLEQRLLDAARRAFLAKSRSPWRWSVSLQSNQAKTKDLLSVILAEGGHVPGRVLFSNVWRGIIIWLRVPTDVKLIYLYKAFRMIVRGEAKEALLRIQQWSTFSKWSKGQALSSPHKGVWKRLVAIMDRWRSRGGSGSRTR